jgi:penicillin-binding protein 2
MLVPSPEWKQRTQDQKWFPGDTANFSIGQGYLVVSPLQMATFIASIARGETLTKPTLMHHPERPRQHTAPLDISRAQHAALIEGMRLCVESGTASRTLTRMMKLGDLKIAGKTGTAQKTLYNPDGTQKGNINFAWFIGFAPHDNPQIAVAVVLEGNVPGEEYGGGLMAAPVAGAVFKKYFDKQTAAASAPKLAETRHPRP